MSSSDRSVDLDTRSGLLVDTNLLVLFVVGSINRKRIEKFKRTSQYSESDYDLLVRVLGQFKTLYTVAHVMAEVSNLTDLSGRELQQGRSLLQETLTILQEPVVASERAARSVHYESLGLTDAAIAELAREHNCAVLTDDLSLYLTLSNEGITALNFTHLRASNWRA